MLRLISAAIVGAMLCMATDPSLIDSVKLRNRRSVEAMLKAHGDVNAKLPNGSTALSWAAYEDEAEIVDLLLKAGARITADEYGDTPLTLACQNGSATIVGKLLQAGADANAARWNGETALMIAARSGNPQTVALLIEHGAKPDSVELEKGQSALMWAAAEGNAGAVDVLLKAGANPNLTSKSGFTPMAFAVIKGDARSTTLLVSAGAKTNAPIPGGTSPLLLAMSDQKIDVADVLISNGADLASKDQAGNTALHLGAESGDLDLVQKMIAKGADVNAKTNKAAATRGRGGGRGKGATVGEQTPLLLAAKGNHLDVMRVLVAAGADPKLTAQDGSTLLMEAARSGNIQLVQYAFELSPDVKAVAANKQTVMHAVMSGSSPESKPEDVCRIIQFLADKGADLDSPDAAGKTPLASAPAASMGPEKELLAQLIKTRGSHPAASPSPQ